MFARLHITLLVSGSLMILAACSPAAPVELTTASPSDMAEETSTPEETAETQSSPAPLRFDCQNVQEIPVEECQGLVALYESTNGDTWQENSGWLADDTPCDWIGVTCEQGHVMELQLSYNELAGPLPSEIGNLSDLKYLYLNGNQLSGLIPAEIGNLSELMVARLEANQFTSIPVEFSRLSKLIELDLSRNQLSGTIPSELGDLPNLTYLGLGSNQLTGDIPSTLGKLSNLTHLTLSDNQLSGPIPDSLGELLILNELNLSYNELTGSIPAELGNLTSLYLLDLSYNQLTGDVPEALANAVILDLRLWGNQLNGTVAASNQPATPVEYRGIRFAFDSTLAESVWPEVRPERPMSPDTPPWEVKPEHVRFTFAGLRAVGDLPAGGMGPFSHPQIMIFPTETFRTMNDFARQEIEDLEALLETRPPAPENEIPLLPLINAAQAFHAQVKYLDFENGNGVRFITQYSQDISPITNQTLFYTFQGLTRDGAYYVSASFPIDAAGLPDRLVPEDWDWETFGARYEEYLTETTNEVDALSSGQFEPHLTLLDQVVQSLRVTGP